MRGMVGPARRQQGAERAFMTIDSTGRRERRTLLRFGCAACVAAAAWTAGCAGLGGPRVITLSEADLARALDRQFPFEGRLLELIDLHVQAPRLRLLPEANRIATDLEVSIGERVLHGGYRGELSLDYGLRYEPSDQSVRLSQVRVQRLRFGNLPAGLQAVVDRIGPLVAEQLLQDLSIYRFTAEDLHAARGRGYEPGAVDVTPRGVEITLSPRPR